MLGAEIVQVEARSRLDSWRGSGTSQVPAALAQRGTPGRPWDLNPLFNSVNMAKRSITLDLAAPDGVDLFRRLVPRVDFVAENFSPRVLGGRELADERFATAAGRRASESDLEAAIGRRTARRDKRELAEALAAVGVPAAAVLDVGEVMADSDLSARGVLRTVTHSLAGEATQAGLPLRMANTPLPPWGPSPLHGEHSLEVLQQELGLSEQAYAALVAAGITGCGPAKGN